MSSAPLEAKSLMCTPADVERIAAGTNLDLRNLQITQCYCELSAAFAARCGKMANWCTFATWASKQAGQTIRREDLKRTLDACLQEDRETQKTLSLIGTLTEGLGLGSLLDQLRQSTVAKYSSRVAEKAANAVSRGNKKVFEEIALRFALFLQTCGADTVYTQQHLDVFCSQLRSGPPPEGQDFLCRAFTHYYQAFYETDEKKKGELCFLANLEIGFHEQTRLQPEIAEALNAGTLDAETVKRHLRQIIFQNTTRWGKVVFLFKRLLGKTAVLDEASAALTNRLQEVLRKALTTHLLTLTLPTGRLQLGKDLPLQFPEKLLLLHHPELLHFLSEIDTTPDSIWQSGATDWASLPERLHFIADLFRCYHEEPRLFAAAFTPMQLAAIRLGTIPEGDL